MIDFLYLDFFISSSLILSLFLLKNVLNLAVASQEYILTSHSLQYIANMNNNTTYNYNKNFQHLPNGIYEVLPEHATDIAEYCTEGFLKYNDIWANANLDRNTLVDFFKKEVFEHLESQRRLDIQLGKKNIINIFRIFEGRISCVTLSYEVYEYKRLQENSVPSEIPLFRQLEREGKQLMKNVNLDVFPRGKYLYATWSVLHYDGELDKFSKGETLIKNQRFYINQGFQGVIFRSSNERMYKLVIPIGGKLMQTVPFIKDGNTYKLFFVDLPFNTELLDMAEQFIHNQRQILAKSISAKL